MLSKCEIKREESNDITRYKGFEEEEIIKEYTTTLEVIPHNVITAPLPSKDKLLETVALFDKSELQYSTYPMHKDGGIVMETTADTDRRRLLETIEKLYGKDEGGVCLDTALRTLRSVSMTNESENTRARLCTVMGNAVFVYDWVGARDPVSGQRKSILTWIPIDTDNPISDEHSRQWLKRKTWNDYTREEKNIFRMNQAALKISHLWVLQRKTWKDKAEVKYKVMKESFVIIVPEMLRYLCNHLNSNPYEVAVQRKIETTYNAEDVLVKQLDTLGKKPSRFDKGQMGTSLVDRVIGRKYDAPKRPREEEMIMDPGITDKNVRDKLKACHSYTITLKADEANYNVFDKILTTLSKDLKATKKVTDMLETISQPNKTFHLLAFISNAEVWMRYGYERIFGSSKPKDSKKLWRPLSYKYSVINNPTKVPMLNDVSQECAEELCKLITGCRSCEINPRYVGIGVKVSQGYRIVNGLIYDIYNYHKSPMADILEEFNKEGDYRNKRTLQELFGICSSKHKYIGKQEMHGSDEIQSLTVENTNRWKLCEESTGLQTAEHEIQISNENQKRNEESQNNTIMNIIKDDMEGQYKAFENNSHLPQNNTYDLCHDGTSEDLNKSEGKCNPKVKCGSKNEDIDDNKTYKNNDTTIHNTSFTITVMKSEADVVYSVIDIKKPATVTKHNKEPGYYEIFVTFKQRMENRQKHSINVNERKYISEHNTHNRGPGKKMPQQTKNNKNQEHPKANNMKPNPPIQQTPINADAKGAKRKLFPITAICKPKSTKRKQNKTKTNKLVSTTRNGDKGGKGRQTGDDEICSKTSQKCTNRNIPIPTYVVPKTISKKQKEMLNMALMKVKHKLKDQITYWLSIGVALQGQATQSVKERNLLTEERKVQKAQRLFNKGNIGKSYDLLINGIASPVLPNEDKLDVLFPNCVKKISVPNKSGVPFSSQMS